MNPNRPDERAAEDAGPDDARWLARTRTALDDDAQAFDAATLSALNRARQRALDVARGTPRRGWLLPLAFAAAASAALAVVLVKPAVTPVAPDPATLDATDLELVAGGELELYDDWEFYAWLDAQPADG